MQVHLGTGENRTYYPGEFTSTNSVPEQTECNKRVDFLIKRGLLYYFRAFH